MNKAGIGRKILSFLLRLVVVLAIMAAIAVASFQGVTYYLTGSFYKWKRAARDTKEVIEEKNEGTETQAVIDNENLETTLLVVDGNDNAAEYVYVSLYNKASGKLDVVLVPSNAKVTLSGDLLKKVQEKLPEIEEDIEITDLAAAYGEEKAEIFKEVFSEVTGLPVKGCDILTLDQFRDVLDAGPEVSYHFTEGMSYRDLSGQLKEIEEGDQMLDGEQGVALITHLDGTADQENARLDRASTYIGSFLSALAKSRKASDVVAKYEETARMDRDDSLTPLQEVVDNLDSDGITIRIMQGGEEDGVFLLDSEKIQLQMAALARQSDDGSTSANDKKDSNEESDDQEDEDNDGGSKDLAIEIFNAAYVEGLARRWEEYLTSEGYNISMIDSYQEDGVFSQTRIRVTEDGMGEDLLQYFPDAEIYVDNIATGGDIRIYLGSDSTNVPEVTGETEDSEESVYDDEE